ncbi:MAG: sporulation protein YqfD [Clostridia bacterium]|nr:sporulation protein YqfD [Clostridia bacterium]
MISYLRSIHQFEIIDATQKNPQAAARFLNLANRRRLRIFNVYCQGDRMYAFIHAADYAKLADAADKAGVTLEVRKTYGLPYRLRHYGKRMGFWIGFGLFCFLLWYLSLFVWFIELEGIPDELMVSASDAVYAAGLRPGTLIAAVDGPQLELELEKELPDFDLIKVSRMGCRALVHFSPSVKKQPCVPESAPCNLIAAQPGEIVDVIATEGAPMVQPGDVVYPGDTLVSGLFPGQEDKIRMVHACGEVTALVEQSFTESTTLRQVVKEPTGRIVTVSRLNAFGMDIPLYYNAPKGLFRKTHMESPISLLGFSLPISLRREEWHELCRTEKNLTADECIAALDNRLDKRIRARDALEVVSDIRTVSSMENGVRVTRHVTFLCSIAEEREILLNDGGEE